MAIKNIDNKSKEIFEDVNPEVAEIKTKVDNLPVDPADASDIAGQISASESNIRGADSDTLKTLSDQQDLQALDSTVAKAVDLATTDGKVDDIKAVTDSLPDAGALTSLAQDATVAKAADLAVVDTVVDAIKVVTDALPVFPSDPADESLLETAITTAESNIRGVDNDTLKTLSDQIDLISGSSDSSGSYNYDDIGGEQDVVTITTSTRKIVQGIWLDLVNISNSGTIRVYYKINGTNYRIVDSFSYNPLTDAAGFFLNLSMGITNDLKVTYQEAVDEAADRDIYYSTIISSIE